MPAMNLLTYIEDRDRKAALAAATGTSEGYLWQIATGWRGKRPSWELAQAIEEATGGEVTRQELRPDIWPANEAEPAGQVA